MRRFIPVLALLVALFAGAGQLHAQQPFRFSELNMTMPGRGTMQIGSSAPVALTGVNVMLMRKGQAQIQFSGDMPATITGTWRGGNSYEVSMKVRGGFGTPDTFGRGTIFLLSPDRIGRIEMAGLTNQMPFSLYFTSESPPFVYNFNELSLSSRGTGTFTMQGNAPEPLRYATVNLMSDGTAQIKLVGVKTHILTGRWDGGSTNTVEASINGGFGDTQTTGSGRVFLLSPSRLDRIFVTGRAGDNPYRVDFFAT
jgi:hypothetical protein